MPSPRSWWVRSTTRHTVGRSAMPRERIPCRSACAERRAAPRSQSSTGAKKRLGDEADLDVAEQLLKQEGLACERRREEGLAILETRDPDRTHVQHRTCRPRATGERGGASGQVSVPNFDRSWRGILSAADRDGQTTDGRRSGWM